MQILSMRVPSMREYRLDTRRILIGGAALSLGFQGLQALLKVLYILRLGYGLEYVGIYTAIGALTYMVMSIPSGALGARFGMKPMMVLGAVATTIGMLTLPVTEFVPIWARDSVPIVSQMFMTTGWALFSINAVPALMNATTDATRDGAYALYGMLRGAGAFIGTIIGGLLPMIFAALLGTNLDGPAPYRWALLLGAATGFIGMIALMKVQDVDAESRDEVSEAHGPFPILFVAVILLHVFLIHGGAATVTAFGNAYMDTELRLSAATIGLLTGVGQFLAVLAPLAMPMMAARRSNAWTLMASAFAAVLFMLPLAFLPTWYAAGFGRIGIIALFALWLPALQAFQMNVMERHWRSMAYGIVSMGMGFSFGVVSLVGGFFAASYGYSALFSVGIVLSFGGGVVMWAMRKVPSMRILMEPKQTDVVVAPKTRSASAA